MNGTSLMAGLLTPVYITCLPGGSTWGRLLAFPGVLVSLAV